MDTILVQRPQFEKAATSAAGIGIAICLLLSQNTLLSAKDLGNLTGISPTLKLCTGAAKTSGNSI